MAYDILALHNKNKEAFLFSSSHNNKLNLANTEKIQQDCKSPLMYKKGKNHQKNNHCPISRHITNTD